MFLFLRFLVNPVRNIHKNKVPLPCFKTNKMSQSQRSFISTNIFLDEDDEDECDDDPRTLLSLANDFQNSFRDPKNTRFKRGSTLDSGLGTLTTQNQNSTQKSLLLTTHQSSDSKSTSSLTANETNQSIDTNHNYSTLSSLDVTPLNEHRTVNSSLRTNETSFDLTPARYDSSLNSTPKTNRSSSSLDLTAVNSSLSLNGTTPKIKTNRRNKRKKFSENQETESFFNSTPDSSLDLTPIDGQSTSGILSDMSNTTLPIQVAQTPDNSSLGLNRTTSTIRTNGRNKRKKFRGNQESETFFNSTPDSSLDLTPIDSQSTMGILSNVSNITLPTQVVQKLRKKYKRDTSMNDDNSVSMINEDFIEENIAVRRIEERLKAISKHADKVALDRESVMDEFKLWLRQEWGASKRENTANQYIMYMLRYIKHYKLNPKRFLLFTEAPLDGSNLGLHEAAVGNGSNDAFQEMPDPEGFLDSCTSGPVAHMGIHAVSRFVDFIMDLLQGWRPKSQGDAIRKEVLLGYYLDFEDRLNNLKRRWFRKRQIHQRRSVENKKAAGSVKFNAKLILGLISQYIKLEFR